MKRISLLMLGALAMLSAVSCNDKSDEIDLEKGIVYELNVRQLTPEGSFKAAASQMQHIRNAGADIVWVMPMYPIGEKERKGTLGSYYAIRDYRSTNPEFGTLEDFRELVSSAHKAGMKIIVDWVANHTSPDHVWEQGKPAGWYMRDENGNTVTQYDWTDIARLNYGCAEMRSEMQDCMRFWLDLGIDGFRCDMAYIVPQDFWTETISALRSEYDRPLYFLAEGEEPWLHDAGFNTTYAWRLHHALNDIAQGKIDKDSLARCINGDLQRFPADSRRLTFTSNHDENSWAGTEFERMGNAWKAMSVLCWTLPQSQPLIYTGQEIGYDHRFQFFEKDPIPSIADNDTTEFYRMLAATRKEHPAITDGEFEILETGDPTLFSFRRSLGDDVVDVSVRCCEPWNWSIDTAPGRISHMEPPCWWKGMKTELVLMVNGPQIGSYDISIHGLKGVRVTKVETADSPNYAFVSIDIADNAETGTAHLIFKRGDECFKYPYEIHERKEGSAMRESFSTKDAIYLLMPDRFRNGDPSNDNTYDTSEKADKSAFFGRHGGDIQGIIDKLDYIADLGFTAIWTCPILEDNEPQVSYHGYACTNYYKVDSRFGGNEMYRAMISEAHRRGIKIILDVVTNHCGEAHWWYSDLPYEDWVHQWPEYTHSNCAFSAQNDPYCSEYDKKNMQEGWFDTTMVDMNLDNPHLLQYFKQWAVWWIEWAGLDGFRVDTYPYNEKIPMAEWCQAVLNEYPNFNIVGEVWSNNVPQVAYWQADNPNKDGFNSHLPSIMDFPLYSAICQSINVDKEYWNNGITLVYDSIANDYYYQNVQDMMIFMGNHDTDHMGDIVGRDPAKMKLIYSLMATLRGYPQIFSGDELMLVASDRTQGDGGRRVELPDNWEADPVMTDLHDYFRTLFQWRKTSAAVHEGRTVHFLKRDNTYAYFRILPEETVFVYVNNNAEIRTIPWSDYSEVTGSLVHGRNVVTDRTMDFSVPVTVGPKEALVVEFK